MTVFCTRNVLFVTANELIGVTCRTLVTYLLSSSLHVSSLYIVAQDASTDGLHPFRNEVVVVGIPISLGETPTFTC